jgi:hypothetical protein
MLLLTGIWSPNLYLIASACQFQASWKNVCHRPRFHIQFTNLICLGIDILVNAFSMVNNSDRITPEFNFYASPDHPLMLFGHVYQQLSLILTRDSPPSQRSREPPANATSRTQIVLPSSAATPTTPPPSANPVNTQYSSGSSATFSSGAEEKDEHYTDSFANAFVFASYESLRNWLQPLAWYDETNCRLQHSYAAQDNIWLIVAPTRRCL